MSEVVFYANAGEKIVEFIEKEWKHFPQPVLNQYLNFFSNLSNYEEEDLKIEPKILITNHMDAIEKAIPSSYLLEMFSDDDEKMFATRIKALAPFSYHNWNIYIEIVDKKINYGIYKCLNSIKDKSFNELMFEKKVLKEKTDKLFAFLTSTNSSKSISIKGLKENELEINFGLITKKTNDFREEIQEFVDASFSKLRTTKKKMGEIKNLYTNIFQKVFQKVHGTICVVIDKDYKDDGFLSDGIWLKEPICFNKLFTQSRSYSEAKLTGLTDLFIDMLNYDGITVVDNLGRIRAYNVFVETDNLKNINVYGGARKRAAFSIINSRKRKIKGVYFQSQEREIFYQRVR